MHSFLLDLLNDSQMNSLNDSFFQTPPFARRYSAVIGPI